jgi:hypothetical protein
MPYIAVRIIENEDRDAVRISEPDRCCDANGIALLRLGIGGPTIHPEPERFTQNWSKRSSARGCRQARSWEGSLRSDEEQNATEPNAGSGLLLQNSRSETALDLATI